MSGNALTIYYPIEDDGDVLGMNTTESSFIRIYVEEQKIRRLRFTKETTGVLYPMDQIPAGSDRLASFFWAEHVRPTDAQDVFRPTVWEEGKGGIEDEVVNGERLEVKDERLEN